MSCLTMRAHVAAQGGELRYLGIAHGILAHHLPHSIPPRYHPLLLTCQYLYFCTSKASKMSTSAHSQHSRLIAKWRGCRVSVDTCPVPLPSLSRPTRVTVPSSTRHCRHLYITLHSLHSPLHLDSLSSPVHLDSLSQHASLTLISSSATVG